MCEMTTAASRWDVCQSPVNDELFHALTSSTPAFAESQTRQFKTLSKSTALRIFTSRILIIPFNSDHTIEDTRKLVATLAAVIIYLTWHY